MGSASTRFFRSLRAQDVAEIKTREVRLRGESLHSRWRAFNVQKRTDISLHRC
jgi:hypothetical protein